MATLNATNTEPVGNASAAKVDIKFEVVVIPVADVDRAKAFYTKTWLAARRRLCLRQWHSGRPVAQFRFESSGRVTGPDPHHRSYFSFATLNDPDGNTWLSRKLPRGCPDEGSATWTSQH